MSKLDGYESVWHALDAIHAYDIGARDSGVHDEDLRMECILVIETLNVAPGRLAPKSLDKYCRDTYLTDEALEQGYGMEDASEFYRWIADGDYRA